MIYFGGPTRGYNNTPDTSPGTVLMTFTDPKLKAKNLPAAGRTVSYCDIRCIHYKIFILLDVSYY
jgi:hypothetical protein